MTTQKASDVINVQLEESAKTVLKASVIFMVFRGAVMVQFHLQLAREVIVAPRMNAPILIVVKTIGEGHYVVYVKVATRKAFYLNDV